MCRYGLSLYKPHFVCFSCRKMFRRRLLKDIGVSSSGSVDAKCPQCGNLMADMGLDFKAPRQKDIKAWAHIQDLYSVGITFHSCGCSGPGYIPKNREEILKQLESTKSIYINHIRLWSNIELPDTKAEFESFNQKNAYKIIGTLPEALYQKYKKRVLEKEIAVAYWSEKLNQIDKYIETIR